MSGLKKSTHAFCKSLGLSLFSLKPANSVTAIKVPENLSATNIKKSLQKTIELSSPGDKGT